MLALNPMCKMFFFNFPKRCVSLMGFMLSLLKYNNIKPKLRVVLAGHSIAMVTHLVTKIITTWSHMIGQCLDTMTVARTDEQ